MLVINKLSKKKFLKLINFKKYFLIFISFFTFITALGTYYSIYNSADSNPKLILFFLLLGLISFFILFFSIIKEIIRLFINIKNKTAGSILQKKIVGVFSAIAITPVLIVAIFAVIFFERGIQGWFSKRVSTALEKSSAIAENYTRELRKRVEGDVLFAALRLSQINEINYNNTAYVDRIINTIALERGASELAIITSNGNILFASKNSYFLPRNISPAKIFSTRNNTDSPIVYLETDNNRINLITPIIGHIDLYLYFSRYLDPVIIYNLRSIQQAISDFNLAKKENAENRITFSMVFISVAILLLLLAIWLGINFANSITFPIAQLIEASDRVSKGNLKFKIKPKINKNNEIFKLISSFNKMIKQLFDQREDLVTANQQIDDRRRFTESILTGVKSGVLGVTGEDRIFLANKSALEMLDIDASKLIGKTIYDTFPQMKGFIKENSLGEIQYKEKQIDYLIKGKKNTFVIGVSFENYRNLNSGYVITIENITEMIKIQRAAAWADIAKRIAHEIKNPLTPIQLSIDSLREKYKNQFPNKADEFEKYLETINRQIKDIEKLVNEFSNFARMPRPILKKVNLVNLIQKSLDFILMTSKNSIKLNVKEKDAYIKGDEDQLNRVFINLIKNSEEAFQEKTKKEPKFKGNIEIEIYSNNDYINCRLSDNGPGITDAKKAMTPYFTTKKTGTGLGLPIVSKIINEHLGYFSVKNKKNGNGTIIDISLPTINA